MAYIEIRSRVFTTATSRLGRHESKFWSSCTTFWTILTSLLTYLLTYLLTPWCSPSWEANWFAASQETPRFLWKPKVHYRTHKRPPTFLVLGQPNPVHIPTSHLLEFHPNIIHPSKPGSPQWSLSLWFPHQFILLIVTKLIVNNFILRIKEQANLPNPSRTWWW